MSVRRVLMTADAVGGVWTYALTLAKALDAEVHLATMGALPSEDQLREADGIPNLTLHTSEYKLEWMPEPWSDVAEAGEWLLDLEADLQPDLVHLNGYCHGAFPWSAPTVMVCHSCVLSWWRAVKGEDAPPEWYRYGYEVARGLRAAQAIVAPTQAMLDCIRDHYGPHPNASVIPNGIEFTDQPASKEPFILTAGRLWDEAKNVATLEAVAQDLPWPVKIAGEGETLRDVQGLGRLSRSQMAEEMARASIYALPARYEPFGLSVLEAARTGCALVLGDIASLRENWQGAALFVDPFDRDGLQTAISRLISNADDRQALAREAKRRAKGFTAARMAGSYSNLYESVLRTHRPKEMTA